MASVATAIPVSLASELASMLAGRPWSAALIDARARGSAGAKTQHISQVDAIEVKAPGYARQSLMGARVEERDGRPVLQFDAAQWTCDLFASGVVLFLSDTGSVGAVLPFDSNFVAGGGSALVVPFDGPIRL